MENYVIIPLTSDPDQTIAATIPINGKNVTLKFRVRYNTQGNYWWLTISDKGGNVLVDGLPLVTGDYPAADILEQYQYLGIGSAVVVNVGNTTLDIPDSTTLGTDFVLVWGDSVG